MEQEKTIILNQLNKMLETKTFSDPVKEKINYVVSKAYDSYSKKEDKKKFFEQLISSLSSANEFRISTRKQLNKRENIASLLSDCSLGVTVMDKSLVAVTKEKNVERTIYHEMIHLTQPENTYHVTGNYPFSTLITFCLREGEASYHDSDLKKDSDGNKIEILSLSNGEELGLESKNSYPFFSMVYESLIDIFGEEIMTKWKNIGPNVDIMPLLKETFEKKFPETPFIVFYQIITKMLVEYFIHKKPTKPQFKNYISNEIEILGVNNSIYGKIMKKYEIILNSIQEIIINIEQNKSYLKDEKLTKDSFERLLEEEQKELNEFKESPEYDSEVGANWQHEIETATLDDYRESLLDELEQLKKELDRLNQEKNKLLKDIENQEFSKIKAEGYLDDEYGFAFCCNLLYKFSGNDTENFEIYKLSKKTKKG